MQEEKLAILLANLLRLLVRQLRVQGEEEAVVLLYLHG
jgi:hypothetical protein